MEPPQSTPPARASAEQLRLVVDSVTDYAIFLLDPTGHVRSWNAGARRIKGYEADEIIGQHFSRFYGEADVSRGYPDYELKVAAEVGRYEDEGWRYRKDGSRFWANVIITALRVGGELVGFSKVTRDLTERRLAEEQLRLRSAELIAANADLEQFRLMVASVRDYAIFALDAGGHVRTWNEGARRIKGYSEEEVIGRHFSLFYTDEDRARDHPAHELEVAARVGRFEEEGWRVRSDGTRFWANVVLTALRDERGILMGYTKVTRDLTERRAQDQRLRQSNEELERFASTAAHDLVEPLHTIVGLTDLLERRHGDNLDERGRELVEHVRGAAERLRTRVDGLLAYARSSQRDIEVHEVALGELVGNVVAALRRTIEETGAEIAYDAERLPRILADPPMLEIVLQNLVANALKFRRPDAVPHVAIDAAPDRIGWRITVTDDGVGIPAAERERVFAFFHRADATGGVPGTGLGLPLVRRIVERHGGQIGIEPGPGEVGTRVWFTLPETPPQPDDDA